MGDEKPNVFPNNKNLGNDNNPNQPLISEKEKKAAEEMARKTAEQIAERERLIKKQEEIAKDLDKKRDEMLNQQPPTAPPISPPINGMGTNEPEDNNTNSLSDISQPQINASFDLIPLPSEGKLYKHKKKSLRVAYLTASDENILSNPNLTESGEFLEILINRKILDPEIRYKDLHVGDRNAILIWLRATAYGPEYPIQVYDPETYEPFEYVVDLSKLKTIKLGAEPDNEGLFDFTLPISKKEIKFKLLTVGELDDIEKHVDEVKKTLGPKHIDTVTYTLSKQIVEIDGVRDKEYINNFVETMLMADSRKLRKYIDEIESGVDMKLEVRTPGGESIKTFLPINFNFFWPEL